ncbi:MAG: undecaprenyldiphospho-muramoylpentapeptide beta-N-acetylglucosaminyltransferase [Pseudomonadota bacterium]
MASSPSHEKKIALLCAGGTGGHLFPAHALASELKRAGFTIHLVSDERIERFAGDFPADQRHAIPSATLAGKSPIKLVRALYRLGKGFLAARRLIRSVKPDIVVGFGGYPTLPPVLAAASKGVPTLIHEANAVLGRANRFLAPRVNAVAIGLPLGRTPGRSLAAKLIETGNPVRDSVIEAAKTPYQPSSVDTHFHLTVFGGSQGAQFFSAVVPRAVGLLSEEQRSRLKIVQQARLEDEQAVRSAYQVMEIEAEVAPFFSDMPNRIAHSHLIVSRSGASTTAELAVIGRPALLVPYPHALDHDQAANAAALAENGGAWIKKQSEITPQWLAEELGRLMDDADILSKAADAALNQGKPDAAKRLSDAVFNLVEGQPAGAERLVEDVRSA